MLYSASLFILAAETRPLPETDWQERLVSLVFKDISAEGLIKIHSNRTKEVKDFCDLWRCISCSNDRRVSSLYFSGTCIGNFNIYALPNSTTYLSLTSCGQEYPIITRSLPRCVETVLLERNRLFGRIDMHTLPPLLKRLYLLGNHIIGPIHLTNLPKTLEVLDLRQNKIRQRTVFYGELPPELKYIIVTEFQASGNKVNEYRALYPEHKVKDDRMFRGISSEKVF